jgi:hypothetical protein
MCGLLKIPTSYVRGCLRDLRDHLGAFGVATTSQLQLKKVLTNHEEVLLFGSVDIAADRRSAFVGT